VYQALGRGARTYQAVAAAEAFVPIADLPSALGTIHTKDEIRAAHRRTWGSIAPKKEGPACKPFIRSLRRGGAPKRA